MGRFGAEWSEANLNENQAGRWVAKINANSERVRKRYSICGWFDVNIEHGGPNPETSYRKRRQAEIEGDEATTTVEEATVAPAESEDDLLTIRYDKVLAQKRLFIFLKLFTDTTFLRTIRLSVFIRSLLATENGPCDISPIVDSSLIIRSTELTNGKQSS